MTALFTIFCAFRRNQNYSSHFVGTEPISSFGLLNSTIAFIGFSPVPAFALKQTVKPLKFSFSGSLQVMEIGVFYWLAFEECTLII